MNSGILAGKLEIAIRTIQEKTGIDISRSTLGRTPNLEHFQLYQLEKIASEVEPKSSGCIGYAETMKVIREVKGVGPSLATRIGEQLADLLPEDAKIPQYGD